MASSTRLCAVGALALLVAACGDAQSVRAPTAASAETVAAPANSGPGPSAAEPSAEPSAPDVPEDGAFSIEVHKMLARVSEARALPAKAPVKGQVLDRAAVIERVRAKAEQELPKGVLEAQGELLRGLGLIDPDYAFVDGIYELIEGNLAGFYDQHEDTMFILDDLPESAVGETLAHELVHALQDQHFDLTAMLKYTPGDTDRVTAGHALAEGDAMSAMFDLTLGDSRKISVRQLRMAMVASVAFSGSGDKTPRVLQASLIAPYVDGFRFVQELRDQGGWHAVDQAYARLPASTEQLLHVDRYMANEQPLAVKTPALPQGFTVRDQDVLGEQGMRMVFEQWSTNKLAAAAAEGWGGDRFAVGRREVSGGVEWAAAWVIAFDAEAEALEAATLLKQRHKPCATRSNLGPMAWRRKGTHVSIVVGPFRKSTSGELASASTCGSALRWLAKL